MLSAEDNRRLTEVGPGTPMGALLRRYWQPIAAVGELAQDPIRPVRLLGEDLVLYRDRSGTLGLVERRCPHRGADLAYGITDRKGIRCSYHGWCFDQRGQCVEQPFEDVSHPAGAFRDKVAVKAYPVRALAGLVWAYLGPEPAPCLPDWARFHEAGQAVIVLTPMPCNWLQCQENSLDPLHFEWLHQNLPNDRFGRGERGPRHLQIAFDAFEWGYVYRRVLDNTDQAHPLWQVGRVSLWPQCLYTGGFAWHVPIDDQHTLDVQWSLEPESLRGGKGPVHRRTHLQTQPDGRYRVHDVQHQDAVAMIGQGVVADRTRERLGESDRGIIQFRKRLMTEMQVVADGGEPFAVLRDEARNHRIPLPLAPSSSELRLGRAPPATTLERWRGKVRAALVQAAAGGVRDQLAAVRAKVTRRLPTSVRDVARALRAKARPAGPDLRQMIHGYQLSALIYVVAKLGVADALARGPKSADAIAREVDAHAPSLGRIMRALVAFGLFTEVDGRFAATASGRRLASDVEGSLRGSALLAGEEFMPAWGGLLHTARTGETAFGHVFGMTNWEHRRAHPELDAAFNRIIASGAEWAATLVCERYDWSKVTHVTDVGGGVGTFLGHVLRRVPHLRGTVFDQPHVVAQADLVLKRLGVDERCDIQGGDFFGEVPAGGDAYLLKNVLHDWDDATSLTILRACRAAMRTEGQRLIVIEALLPAQVRPGDGRLLSDMHMLAVDGGRERDEAGFRALLAAGGFEVTQLIVAGETAIIEAK